MFAPAGVVRVRIPVSQPAQVPSGKPFRPSGLLPSSEAITEDVRARSGVSVEPMQLAALLLEKTTEQLNEDEVKALVTVRLRASR